MTRHVCHACTQREHKRTYLTPADCWIQGLPQAPTWWCILISHYPEFSFLSARFCDWDLAVMATALKASPTAPKSQGQKPSNSSAGTFWKKNRETSELVWFSTVGLSNQIAPKQRKNTAKWGRGHFPDTSLTQTKLKPNELPYVGLFPECLITAISSTAGLLNPEWFHSSWQACWEELYTSAELWPKALCSICSFCCPASSLPPLGFL